MPSERVVYRVLAAALLAGLAACQSRPADEFRPTAACGAPNRHEFHAVQVVVMRATMPADFNRLWTQGCAVVSFNLDADGVPTDPQVLSEQPRGGGAGPLALVVLPTRTYAPVPAETSELDPGKHPRWRYAVTFGFINAYHQQKVEMRSEPMMRYR